VTTVTTVTAAGPTAPSGGRPAAEALVRRGAWPLAIAGMVLAAIALTLLIGGRGNSDPLDPGGADPHGSRALAQVLGDHGVHVQIARSAGALATATHETPNATVLVSRTDLLSAADVVALHTEASNPGQLLVLVVPDQSQLDRLAPGIRVIDSTDRKVVAPGCSDPLVVRAGAADAGGDLYSVPSGSDDLACYPVDGHPSYVIANGASPVIVIGQPSLLTNERLAQQGDAALMVGALGRTGQLVWFVPSAEFVGGQQHSLTSLLPGWVGWVALQLLLVTLVCMLWRGRRLGRLVPEPLPVVVRAVETTEGRARMYRRARAHDRAAATLREATLTRLRQRTGLPRSAPVPDVVAVVSAQTGIPSADIAGMLLGPPPPDDAGLVRLAQILDQLDREVRRP
jgi:hypothetical protein